MLERFCGNIYPTFSLSKNLDTRDLFPPKPKASVCKYPQRKQIDREESAYLTYPIVHNFENLIAYRIQHGKGVDLTTKQ